MSKQLIGFCGFARSGKDTAALALTSSRLGWSRKAFADALKRDVLYAVESSWESAYDREPPQDLVGLFHDPATKEKFRPLLVEYGRAMRNIEPGYWVHRLSADLRNCLNYAVTDVRYKNEADWIHSLGGRVILIQRPEVTAANDEESASIGAMIAAGCFDLVIQNDSSVEELHTKVLHYVDSLENLNPEEENS